MDGPAEVLAGEAAGAQVAYHGADMSRVADIEDMMKYSASQFGRVDILVNNAGIQHVPHNENSPSAGDSIIAINLTSAFTPRARPARDEERQLGPHHQCGVGARPGGIGPKSAYVAAKHGIGAGPRSLRWKTPPPA